MVFSGTSYFTREFSAREYLYFAIKASYPCSINHVFFSANISLASFSASDIQCKESRQGVLGGTANLGQLITQEMKQYGILAVIYLWYLPNLALCAPVLKHKEQLSPGESKRYFSVG